MNKLRYRVIFNRVRGLFMVVPETAHSNAKGVGSCCASPTAPPDVRLEARLHVLSWALFGAFAACGIYANEAMAQIIADPNAPGRQRPTVLTTASGVLQVNVQTPSAAGVSRNIYSQFDVPKSGAILNNSNAAVQTQLGGWISANPWMSTASARVILNEVNSNNPSQLRGYLEVAGPRAEVVVANAAGIVVDGGGFINVSRATLTTGSPIFSNGDLDGYTVQRGEISLQGAGLDARQTDYTSLIARSVSLNAGLWAQQLNVVSGTNRVSAADGSVTGVAASGAAPVYGIDSASLGGMYANKITLVGTEAGVGVHNAGNIGASAGEVIVTSAGRLENSGSIGAAQQVRLQSEGEMTNSGTVYSKDSVTADSSAAIANAGTMFAEAGLALTAPGAIGNSGTLSGQTGLQLHADTLLNSGTISSSGCTVLTLQHDIDNSHGTIQGTGIEVASISGSITNQNGRILQGGGAGLDVAATTLDNTNAAIVGLPPAATGVDGASGAGSDGGAPDGSVDPAQPGGTTSGDPATSTPPQSKGLLHAAGVINNAGGVISTGGSITVTTNGLDNSSGQMNVDRLTVQGAGFSNRSGSVNVVGDFLARTNTFDNEGGKLLVGGRLDSAAGSYGNSDGLVQADQLLITSAGSVDNTRGMLRHTGGGTAQLSVGSEFNNEQGAIEAAAGLTLSTASLAGSGGKLTVSGDLRLDSGLTSARGATWLVDGAAVLNTAALDNSGGTLSVNRDLILNTGELVSQNGKIFSAGDSKIAASAGIDNAGGYIQSGRNVDVRAGGLLGNQGGTIEAVGVASTADIQAGSLDNTSGRIANVGTGRTRIVIQDNVLNSGLIAGNGDLYLGAQTVQNADGGKVTAAGALELAATRQFDNKGTLSAAGTLSFAQAGASFNNGGKVTAGNAITLNLLGIDNSGGEIATALGLGADLNIDAGEMINRGGVIQSDRDVLLNVSNGGVDNTNGLIQASRDGLFGVAQTLANDGGVIETTGDQSRLLVDAGAIDNGTGRIANIGVGLTDITAATSLTNGGMIAANGSLALGAHVISNDGTMSGAGPLSLNAQQQVNNTGLISSAGHMDIVQPASDLFNRGQIIAGDAITISTHGLVNDGGQIATTTASGAAIAIESGTMSNQGGSVQAAGSALVSAGGALNNAHGLLQSGKDMQVAATGAINNDGGVIEVTGAADSLQISAGALDNGTGRIANAGAGDVSVTIQGNIVSSGLIAGNGNLALTGQSAQNQAGGTIASGRDMKLALTQQLDNEGALHSGGALDFLQTTEDIRNSGQMTAGADANIEVRNFNNDGGLIATLKDSGGGIALTAGSLSNRGGSVLADGSALLTVGGAIDNAQGVVQAGKDIQISASGALNNNTGVIEAIGAASTSTVQAQSIDNTGGSIVNVGAGAMAVTSEDTLLNSGTVLSNGALNLAARAIDNRAGATIAAVGNVAIDVAQQVDNSGLISSTGQLDFTRATATVNNTGHILAGGKVTLAAGSFVNDGGEIATATGSGADVMLRSESLSNLAGLIVADGNIALNVGSGLNNSHGAIRAAGDVRVSAAGALDNTSGDLEAAGASSTLNIGAQAVDNTAGHIVNLGQGGTTIAAQDTIRNSGTLAGNGDLSLYAKTLHNDTDATLAAGNHLNLSITQSLENAGAISSVGAFNFNQPAAAFYNTGQIVFGDATSIATGSFSNDGGMLATVKGSSADVAITAQTLSNRGGTILADGSMALSSAASLDNTGGTLQAQRELRITSGDALVNHEGIIEAAGAGSNIDVHAGAIDNTAGRLVNVGSGDLNVSTSGDVRSSGVVASNGKLDATARTWQNEAGGTITSGKDMNLAFTLQLENQGSIASGGKLDFNVATAVVTNAGQITAAGDMNLAAGSFNNDGGQIATLTDRGATVSLASQSLSNVGGAVLASGSANLSVSGAVDNSAGVVQSGQTLNMTAGGTLANHNGVIEAIGASSALTVQAQLIDNTAGRVVNVGSGATSVSSQTNLLSSGTIAGNGDLSLSAQTLQNAAGGVLSAGAHLDLAVSQQVDNQGTVNSGGALNFNQSAATFNNAGQIVAGDTASFIAGNFNNDGGLIATATNSSASILVDSLSFSNRSGSIVASGAGTFLSGGALDNSRGALQAGGDLQLRAVGTLNNSAGAIESTGPSSALTIQAGAIDSSAGRIVNAGSGGTSLSSQTYISNSGTIAGNGALDLDAQTLQNCLGGSIASGRDLELAITQWIDNQGVINSGGSLNFNQLTAGLNNQGQIVSAGGAAIVAGRIDNDGGTIATARGSGSALTLSSQQLSNQNGLIAADGSAFVSVHGAVNNANGTLQAGNDLRLAATGQLNNNGGRIESLGAASVLDVLAQSIANGSGRITNSGSGDTTLTSASGITSTGVIAGNGNLKLIALSAQNGAGGTVASGRNMGLLLTQYLGNDGVINSAGTLTFNQAGALLENTGQIISGGNAVITANQVVNDGGQIGTGVGSGADLVLTTQQLSNQDGHIAADRDLSLRASAIPAMGDLAAGRDLSVTMDGDYTQGATTTMRANRDITFTTSGNFTNTAKFDAVRNLSLTANQIVNQANGEIGAQGVTLAAAGMLTNAGTINGTDSVDVTAASIDNSNSIIGGDLTLRAQSINNTGSMALLGSTGNMSLQVSHVLSNTDGATIYSAGGIGIAADAARNFTGVVNNIDSTIEAAGDLDLAATTLNNVRSNVSVVQVKTVDETVHMTLPSWEYHGDNHNAYETTAANYAPHEVYFVNPNDILQNDTYVTPDGYTIGRAVIRTHANDSAFFSAVSGLYSAYGDRERITTSDGTRVLYYTYQANNMANPDQGGDPSNVYAFVDTANSWTNAGPTFSSQYGSCRSDCVRFVTQPDYNDPRTTIIRDYVRALAPQAGKLEAYRDAHYTVVEDQLAPGMGGPAQILSGGDMHLTVAEVLNNEYSDIVANGFLYEDGAAVPKNEAVTLHRAHNFDGSWTDDDGDVTAYTMPSINEEIGSVNAVFSGGSGVSISARSFNNIDVSAGTVGNIRASVNVIGSDANHGTTSVDASADAAVNASVISYAGKSGTGNNASGPVSVGATGPLNTAVTSAVAGSGQSDRATVDVRAHSSATANQSTGGANVQSSGLGVHAALAGHAHATGMFAALLDSVRTAPGGSIAKDPAAVTGGAPEGKGDSPAVVPVAPNGLARQNPDPNGSYLFETRPQFANHGAWVSSDYLLKSLDIDPATTQKRLGDGFYEQRMVKEQLLQLTGGAPQDGLSDDSRYRELLTSGVAFAKALNLRPGIALSADQVARLTSDIVWLESETVRLPDGSTQNVLVPKVYLARASADAIKPGGALVTGNGVRIVTTEGILNQGGVIDGGSGRTILATAQDIVNAGGTIRGGSVALAAGNDIRNESLSVKQTYASAQTSGSYTLLSNRAAITATGSLDMMAGRDVSDVAGRIGAASAVITAGRDALFNTLQTGSTYRAQVGEYSENDSTITRQVSQITTSGGLRIAAGRDLSLSATQASIGGAGLLLAGRDMNITSVMTEVNTDQHNNANSKLYDKQVHQNQSVVGASITAGTSLNLIAGISELGALKISGSGVEAAGAVTLGATGDVTIASVLEHHLSDTASHRESSSFLKSKSTTTADFSEARKVVGSSVSGSAVTITSGNDIHILGSAVVGDNDVSLTAAKGVSIEAATATSAESHHSVVKQSGFLAGDGFGFSIGTRTVTTDQQQDATTQSGQARSMFGSLDGNLTIHAGEAVKIAGSDLSAGHDIDLSGKSVSITPGVDSANGKLFTKMTQDGLTLSVGGSVVNAIQTGQQMSSAAAQTSSGRIKALAAATAAMTAKDAADDLAKNGPTVKLSLTVGHSESESTETTASSAHSGSVLTAGNNVTISATGDGKASNIDIIGSEVRAKGDVSLTADNQVNLLAAQDSDSQHSQSKSSSVAVGVGIELGRGKPKVGLTASVSASRGNVDGEGTTQVNSHVSAGDRLTIASGGDTNLKGAVASGNQVIADIKGNLNIESLQDTATLDGKRQSASVSGTMGPAGGLSASVSTSNVHNEYASVQEQSGIKAGDGGFQIKVAGNTDLKGGVISSSEQAIKDGLNSLSTDTLSFSDIQNRDSTNASGISLGMNVGKNQNGSTFSPSMAPGVGQVSGNQSSVTRSGVSGGTLTVAALPEGQIPSTLNREVSTGKDTGPAITKGWTGAQALDEVNAQVQITSAALPRLAKEIGNFADRKADELKSQGNVEEAAKWAEGGTYRVAAHAALGALGGGLGGAVGAGAAAEAAPALNQLQAAVQDKLTGAGLNSDAASVASKLIMGGTAAAIGSVAGGGAGAVTGLNEDANNRQLHPKEIDWIKNNAKFFAKGLSDKLERPVSEAEALFWLTTAGESDVDRSNQYLASQQKGLATSDESLALLAAKQYISGNAKGNFVDDHGQQQRLFVAAGSDFYKPEVYSEYRNSSGYRDFYWQVKGDNLRPDNPTPQELAVFNDRERLRALSSMKTLAVGAIPALMTGVTGSVLGRGPVLSAADTTLDRRAYLNAQFGRTGDLNVDINIRGNIETATNFFRAEGVPEVDIHAYLTGIDLTQPVVVEALGSRKSLWQYQTPGAPQGNWYSFSPAVQPTELGIGPLGFNTTTQTVEPKIQNSYQTAGPVQVLRSTAASVNDTWSVRGQSYPTVGGARQLFSTQKPAFTLTPKK